VTRTLSRLLALLLCLGFLAQAGCEQEERVPYIAPTLANWPQPYHGVAGLKVHLFVTGFLRLSESLVLRGGSLSDTRDLPIIAALIEHPQHGLVLFNTGLGPKSGAASSLPGGMLGLITAEISRGQGVREQMLAAGFKPDAVRWVVLSSARFEHTGELLSFPNARVVVTKAERDYARQQPSGYTPADLDEVSSWKFIDFESAAPLATFRAHVDLLGDDSCLLLDASGATPGTRALLVRLPHQPLLLAADLAAVEESVRYAARPASVYDMDQWWDHIWRLKRFKDLVPELIVVPGYDLGPARLAGARDIVIHPFKGPEAGATPTPGRLQRIIPKPM
jgi:N-acyl homoserine lactone hydrolase